MSVEAYPGKPGRSRRKSQYLSEKQCPRTRMRVPQYEISCSFIGIVLQTLCSAGLSN